MAQIACTTERLPVVEMDPGHAWRALFRGEWRVVDRFDEAPHHLAVCAPSHRSTRRPLLSPFAVTVLHRRARGASGKEIAQDADCTPSSVSLLLSLAKDKLRFRSDADIVAVFGRAEGGGSAPPAPSNLEAWVADDGPRARLWLRSPAPRWRFPASLSTAERHVLEDLLGGASHSAIAFARRRSVRTISNQVASIFQKVGVGSRIELFVALREDVGP